MAELGTRDRLNAFLDLPDTPVDSAKSGPLAGLTLGVKDIFDVKGYVIRLGQSGSVRRGRAGASNGACRPEAARRRRALHRQDADR